MIIAPSSPAILPRSYFALLVNEAARRAISLLFFKPLLASGFKKGRTVAEKKRSKSSPIASLPSKTSFVP